MAAGASTPGWPPTCSRSSGGSWRRRRRRWRPNGGGWRGGPAERWRSLAERRLGVPSFTLREVGREGGVEPAQVRRLWRALGIPPVEDDTRFSTGADVEILREVGARSELRGADPDDL